MRVAAVDIGTNTVRLLVIDARAGETVEVMRTSQVVGLGEGVDRTNLLQPAAIDRALAALSDFERSMTGVDRVRAVATAASREAGNRDDFFDRVESVLGVRPELITGADEAHLAFAGAAAHRPGRSLVIDVGGGSTELVAGDGVPDDIVSLQIGSVRLTERSGLSLPPSAAQLANARALAAEVVSTAPRPTSDAAIGVAGTFTALAALHLRLSVYDAESVDGSTLTAGDLAMLVERLSSLTLEETMALPTMEPRRAPVILGGALVVDAVLRHLNVGEITVSERDLLDGVVSTLLQQ